jgi:hypothetical protein
MWSGWIVAAQLGLKTGFTPYWPDWMDIVVMSSEPVSTSHLPPKHGN